MNDQPLYFDSTFAVARTGNVLLSLWWAAPNGVQLSTFHKAIRALATEPGTVASVVCLSLHSTRVELSDALRSESVAIFKSMSSHPNPAVVLQVEGDGFLVATIRSILSGLILLARPRYRSVIAATRAEAIKQAVDHTATAGHGPQLTESLNNLYTRLEHLLRNPTQ